MYGLDWGTYKICARIGEYLLIALLLMEVLEFLCILFQKCRSMRCSSSKVGDSQIAQIVGPQNVLLQKKGNKDPQKAIFSERRKTMGKPILPDRLGLGIRSENKKNRILPADLGFIDHEQLKAAREDWHGDINRNLLMPSTRPYQSKVTQAIRVPDKKLSN